MQSQLLLSNNCLTYHQHDRNGFLLLEPFWVLFLLKVILLVTFVVGDVNIFLCQNIVRMSGDVSIEMGAYLYR